MGRRDQDGEYSAHLSGLRGVGNPDGAQRNPGKLDRCEDCPGFRGACHWARIRATRWAPSRLRDLELAVGPLGRDDHVLGAAVSVVLPVPQGGPLAIRLEVTKPLIPPHLDKAGKSYGARRDRYDG